MKQWHKKHPGYAVKVAQSWRERNIEKDRANTSEYRKRSQYWKKRNNTIRANPVMYAKWKARQIVRQAVKIGKLQRLSCAVCSISETQGHHTDYSKPLNVTWLCRPHHLQAHNKISRL